MSNRYTAQEMREMAEQILFTCDDWYADAGHMLLQAADMLEGKKKSKRRYEYSMRYYLFSKAGKRIRCTGKSTFSSFNIESAREACDEHNGRHWTVGRLFEKAVVISREVGEWEEVEDE